MSDIQLELETMIDAHGLAQVLIWITEICYEKSAKSNTEIWSHNAKVMGYSLIAVEDVPNVSSDSNVPNVPTYSIM